MAVHTLFNWHKIAVSDSYLNNIEYIDSLKHPTLLAASVQKAFLAKETPSRVTIRSLPTCLFACTEPDINSILIIAVAKVHEKYELDEVGTPQNENFTVLLLLF